MFFTLCKTKKKFTDSEPKTTQTHHYPTHWSEIRHRTAAEEPDTKNIFFGGLSFERALFAK
jgi:hypothetical protein